jgi:tripartite-type tricarboxylate transporter receptor subunit TctC
VGAFAALLAALFALPAAAADFYAGKTVSFYVGFGPGGSYDLYSRIVAHHIQRHIPGNPTIVVRNMPGAGSVTLSNYMTKVAPKDGTALAVVSESVALDQLMGNPGIEYDAGKFGWIGRMASSVSAFFAWHGSPTKTFADAQKRETLLGSSGSGLTTDTPRALNALAGAKFKLITGYRGSTEVMLAMERGEVEVGYGLWADVKTRKADWLADKKINVLFFMAGGRQEGFPAVPISAELGRDAEAKRILELLSSSSQVGRSVLTAPDVAPAQLATLRDSFVKMTRDPEYLAEIKKAGLSHEPLDGAALQKTITDSLSVPRALIEKAKEARK